MQSAKETASNVAASARAGMEKTKATVQEKGEKMITMDPLKKDMATAKKEERIHEAERQKQEARMHNAAAGQTGGALGGDFTTGGEYATEGGLGHTPVGVGTGQTPTTGVTGTRTTTGTGGVGGVHHQDPYSGTGGGRTGY